MVPNNPESVAAGVGYPLSECRSRGAGMRLSPGCPEPPVPKMLAQEYRLTYSALAGGRLSCMSIVERFDPQKGQVVTAEGHSGTFKVLDVSEDSQTADIQLFSLSKQMLIGSVMKNIPCSTLHHFKENPRQAAARIVREAAEQ